MRRPFLVSCVLLSALACGRDPQQRPALLHTFFHVSPEAWDAPNDPAQFDPDTLEYRFASLPREGEVERVPWVGSHWPTARDSINDRWAGQASESPAAKYGRAFGIADLETRVSRAYGLKSITRATPCINDGECGADERCVTGTTVNGGGRCIPLWWGLGHGWASAAILTPEPRHAVTLRGVAFEVNDIKALLTIVHDQTPSTQVSLRCNVDEQDILIDEAGRPMKDRACRDANPGAYHVLLANLLGQRKQSFVEDNTWDIPIWNYPLRSFDIETSREVSAAEANRLLGRGRSGDPYRFNADAPKLTYVKTNVHYIGADMPRRHAPRSSRTPHTYVDTYEYILEMDEAGKIVGGEWVGETMRGHPDFVWLPRDQEPGATRDAVVSYKDVMELAAAAQQ